MRRLALALLIVGLCVPAAVAAPLAGLPDALADPLLDAGLGGGLDPVVDPVVDPVLDPVLDAVVDPVVDSVLDGGAGPLERDPLLAEALAAAAPDDTLVVVVSVSRLAGSTEVAALAGAGLEVVPYTRLAAVAARGTPLALVTAAGLGFVEGMWLDRPLELVLAESVPLIGAADVHASPYDITGAGVGIAVLDSGIDGTHPDLAFGSKTVQNVKLVGHDEVFRDGVLAIEDVPNTDTTTGHGTHVAGIAAGDGTASGGRYTGVAPGATLVGIGAADGVELLTAMSGYDWLLANHDRYGVRVLNNSWADGTIEYDPDHPLNRASAAAAEAGIVVVFAAGNDGQTGGNVFNRYAYPDWVVSVAGGTKTGHLDTYSSRGSAEHHPDLVAPGSWIASTIAKTGVVGLPNQTPFDFTDPLNPRMVSPEHWPYYSVKLGTSMAAPHVAGVAALILQANPGLTPAEVRALLVATATPMPGCPVVDCGYGYVNALAAVQAALGALNQPPVAVLEASPTTGAAPLTVRLDASGSYDPDGSVASYAWDVDGSGVTDVETTGPWLDLDYDVGVWRPTVTVTDDRGARSVPAAGPEIRVGNPPVAIVEAPAKARSGEPVTFDASASFDPDGGTMHFRYVLGDGTEVECACPTLTHTYTVTRSLRMAWVVEVTDDIGLRDAVAGSLRVTPSPP